MMADPRRVRLLIVAVGIFTLALTGRLIVGGQQTTEPVDAGPVVTEDVAEPAEPGGTADAVDLDAEIERAHEVAATFAQAYLTHAHDADQAERARRLAQWTTDEFAVQLENARDAGMADQDAGSWEHTAEVTAVQTQMARRSRIEVVVMVDLEVVEDGSARTVATNLGVGMTNQDGTWLVEDMT